MTVQLGAIGLGLTACGSGAAKVSVGVKVSITTRMSWVLVGQAAQTRRNCGSVFMLSVKSLKDEKLDPTHMFVFRTTGNAVTPPPHPRRPLASLSLFPSFATPFGAWGKTAPTSRIPSSRCLGQWAFLSVSCIYLLPPFCIVLSEHRRRDTVAGPATLPSWARSPCVSKALLIVKEKIASVQGASFVRNHEGQTTLVMHHLIGLFISPVAWNPTQKPFILKQQYRSMVTTALPLNRP